MIILIGSVKRGKLHQCFMRILKMREPAIGFDAEIKLLVTIDSNDVIILIAGIVLDTGIAVYTTRNAYPVGTSVEFNYSMMISNHIYACEVCIDIIVFKSHVIIKVLLRSKSKI